MLHDISCILCFPVLLDGVATMQPRSNQRNVNVRMHIETAKNSQDLYNLYLP